MVCDLLCPQFARKNSFVFNLPSLIATLTGVPKVLHCFSAHCYFGLTFFCTYDLFCFYDIMLLSSAYVSMTCCYSSVFQFLMFWHFESIIMLMFFFFSHPILLMFQHHFSCVSITCIPASFLNISALAKTRIEEALKTRQSLQLKVYL